MADVFERMFIPLAFDGLIEGYYQSSICQTYI